MEKYGFLSRNLRKYMKFSNSKRVVATQRIFGLVLSIKFRVIFQRGMETWGRGRRTSRARHVPDHIPGGGHVQDAVHDKRQYREETRAERQEQDHPGGAQRSDRAHSALSEHDQAHGPPGPPAAEHGRQDTENDDDASRKTRSDHSARWSGVR